MMETIGIWLAVVLLAVILFLLIRMRESTVSSEQMKALTQSIQSDLLILKNSTEQDSRLDNDMFRLLAQASGKLDTMAEMVSKSDAATREFMKMAREDLERIRSTVSDNLEAVRADNTKQLEEIGRAHV